MTNDNTNQETKPPVVEPVLDNVEEMAMEAAASLEAATLALTIDFEGLKPNSVLVVKIPADSPEYHARIYHAITQGVLMPRMDLLKDKKVGVLFMTTEDTIELLSEDDMAKAGWERKEKNRIITP